MIKMFCDGCGKEIPANWRQANRYKAQIDRITISVMVAVDNVWNAGHVCDECLLKVVNEGERLDRHPHSD